MKSHYIECACDSDEHTLRYVYSEEDNEMYTSIHLNNYQAWYKRVWVAVKYIFGYRCKFGHWDCTILDVNGAKKLKVLCNMVIDNARK